MKRSRNIAYFLVAAFVLVGSSSIARTQTIHAIIVADTTDGTIGPGVVENVKNIKAFLKAAESLSSMSVAVSEVSGDAFDCSAITKAVDGLTVSREDVVLFYYSGHGFRRDTSQTKFPEFDCRRTAAPDRAALATVVTSIQSKQPRLILAFADTCNVKIEPFLAPAAAAGALGTEEERRAAFRHLFRDYSGTLMMSGAVPGEFSWYLTSGPSVGGFFTNQLLRAINRQVNDSGREVRWEAIAADATKPIFIPTQPDSTTQNPQYASLNLSSVKAQAVTQDEVDPASVRQAWIAGEGGPIAAAPPYTLTASERAKFGGTFGIDLSHYSFDIANADPVCRSSSGYLQKDCSCTIDWDKLASAGITYVYTKASDGTSIDPSLQKVWPALENMHTSRKLFRGAYHFLRPGLSAMEQAQTFLQAIGATTGQPPLQLQPVLDIEWSNRRIVPGTTEFGSCPASRRTKTEGGTYYCDMWYTMSSAEIAAAAAEWIRIVEERTHLTVAIYTNPSAWWDRVISPADDGLLKGRPVWTSRYTNAGPSYVSAWTAQNGSAKWKMAPLPRGASYAQDAYTIPHFWQFTEAGHVADVDFVCRGHSEHRAVDLNWIPLSPDKYPLLQVAGHR